MSYYRTHTCNDLRASHAGQAVVLSGWLHMSRDIGGILFIVLRDHYGSTQLVVHPDDAFYAAVKDARVESTIRIEGVVGLRPEGQSNPSMTTGEIAAAYLVPEATMARGGGRAALPDLG